MKHLLLSVIILIGLTAVNYSGQASDRHRTPDKPFPNSSFIEIDQMLLHYRIWPATLPNDTLPWVFMVHGMGGSTYSWEYNAPALAAAGFNVVAIDVPPFGYSGKNPNFNQSVDSRAKLFWKFLNRIRPDARWNLIGHSMGGGIVLQNQNHFNRSMESFSRNLPSLKRGPALAKTGAGTPFLSQDFSHF